jgi:hypothetical protein
VIPRVAGANLIASGCSVAPRGRITGGGPRLIPGIVAADPARVGIAPEEGYGAPSDDHAARMLAATVPPDSTRNRLPHAPDGVLSRKNHLCWQGCRPVSTAAVVTVALADRPFRRDTSRLGRGSMPAPSGKVANRRGSGCVAMRSSTSPLAALDMPPTDTSERWVRPTTILGKWGRERRRWRGRRRRPVAQLLADRSARSVEDVVTRLLAVQAHDDRGARLACEAGHPALAASDVDHALTAKPSLVTTWLNRGTLHLVAADDYWWLHSLTTLQLTGANGRRLRQEG